MVVGDVERVRRGAGDEGDVRAGAAEQAHPVGRQRVDHLADLGGVAQVVVQHQRDQWNRRLSEALEDPRWLASA